MRKIVFYVSIFLLILSVLSCSRTTENDEENESVVDVDAVLDKDTEIGSDFDVVLDENEDVDTDEDLECVCDNVEGDEDGDGIPNTVEGCEDSDYDGTPNCMDEDSDNDGISDKRECPSQPCADTDEDGTPDFLDRYSDADSLSDSYEHNTGTDPYNSDTDGDGVSDCIEKIIETDPLDKSSHPPDGIYYTYLKNNHGGDATVLIDFLTSGENLDIVTMIDVTGSMQKSIDKIREQVISVISEDLPVKSDGYFAFGTVEAPYNVVQSVTESKDLFFSSLNKVQEPEGYNEILLESIYQSAAGDGLKSEIGDYAFGSVIERTPVDFPKKECTDQAGNIGGVCFRKDADHLLVVFTDEEVIEFPSENNPDSLEGYLGTVWTKYNLPGHNMLQTRLAMSLNHVKILVVNTGFECDEDGNNCEKLDYATESHDYISKMTGTTDVDGNTYNFHAEDKYGNGIRERLADAVKKILNYAEKDITLEFEGDVFGYGGKKTTDVIRSFRPVNSDPSSGIEDIDENTFYKVKQNTKLTFEITVGYDGYFPGETGSNIEEFTVKIVSGKQVLGVRIVRFIYDIGE